jgi:hypothetical protein
MGLAGKERAVAATGAAIVTTRGGRGRHLGMTVRSLAIVVGAGEPPVFYRGRHARLAADRSALPACTPARPMP